MTGAKTQQILRMIGTSVIWYVICHLTLVFCILCVFSVRVSAFPLERAARARPRDRRHERPLSQHGGLWYHLWVGRRGGWARSERGALGQILSGARGHARGRVHHSVSGVTSVAAVCRAVVALLSSVRPSLAWLAATVSLRETQLRVGKLFGGERS